MGNNFCDIFKDVKSIAVLGLSDNIFRDSRGIALMLKSKGFDVYGVHPKVKKVEDISVYANLNEIPVKIDLVDVFVNGDRLDELFEEIISIKPKYVWFQLGVENDSFALKLEQSGVIVIKDRCIAVEYRNCRA